MAKSIIFVYPGPEESNVFRADKGFELLRATNTPIFTAGNMGKYFPELPINQILPAQRSSIEDTWAFREIIVKPRKIERAYLVTSNYHAHRVKFIAERMLTHELVGHDFSYDVLPSFDKYNHNTMKKLESWERNAFLLDKFALAFEAPRKDPRNFQILVKEFPKLIYSKIRNQNVSSTIFDKK